VQPDILSKKTVGRAIAVITLCALGLRLLGLTRQSLWVDEIFSIKYAQLYGSMTWEALRVNLHGPLHALVLHLWSGFAGNGEFAVRLLQALVSAAAILILFLAARPYVLFYEHDFYDPGREWERFLMERFPIEESWEFPGSRIWRLGEDRGS
jgi:hypothetical protein